MADFSSSTLMSRMSGDNYSSLVSMKTNYGGNFLSGMPTLIVGKATGALDNLMTTAIGTLNSTTGVVTSTLTSAVSSVTSFTTNIANQPNVLMDFTGAAILDLTEKVQQLITSAIGEMLALPSLGEITSKSAEYLTYYIIKPELFLEKFLTPSEVMLKIKEKLALLNILDRFNKWIKKYIGKTKEFLDKYLKKFKEFLENILNYAKKGVDFLCKLIAIAELDVIDSIDYVLHGGDPIIKRKLREKNARLKELTDLKKRIDLLLNDEDNYDESGNLKDIKTYTNLLSKSSRLETKIELITLKILKLLEKDDKKQQPSEDLMEEIKNLKTEIPKLSDINQIDDKVHLLINLEAQITARNGVVGYVNSKKQIIINNLAARVAKSTAKPINAAVEKALKKVLDLLESIKELGMSKVKAAITKAIIKLLLLSS